MNLPLPQKRLIACVFILVFVVLWIVAASAIARHLPDSQLARLAFYAIAGTCWGLPVLPVISWSENYTGRKRGGRK